MIDTIVIRIPSNQFAIKDHSRFTPSSKSLFFPPFYDAGKRGIRCLFIPSKQDLEKYNYLPRISIIKVIRKGGFETSLLVEFSAPKLLFGNNFDELTDQDFVEVCYKLYSFLNEVGIEILNSTCIKEAVVSSIHFGKNFILNDYSTPYYYLSLLSKVNINMAYDLNSTDFRNGGYAVKYHSNDFEVIFYDKLKDLQRSLISEKKAVEKDNDVQANILQNLKTLKPFEVLRFEVRFGSKKRLKRFFEANNISVDDYSFNTLFSGEIAQKVLLAVFNTIQSNYPNLLKDQESDIETNMVQLLLDNPSLKSRDLILYTGLKKIISEIGVRKLRIILENSGKKEYWYQINKGMKNLVVSRKFEPFKFIESELNKFETISLATFF